MAGPGVVLIYVCLTAAGTKEFSDQPCVTGRAERPPPIAGTIIESPPRVPEGWGLQSTPYNGPVYFQSRRHKRR